MGRWLFEWQPVSQWLAKEFYHTEHLLTSRVCFEYCSVNLCAKFLKLTLVGVVALVRSHYAASGQHSHFSTFGWTPVQWNACELSAVPFPSFAEACIDAGSVAHFSTQTNCPKQG